MIPLFRFTILLTVYCDFTSTYNRFQGTFKVPLYVLFNISSVVEFWGVPVRQKLGMILENKVVQKLKFEFFLQRMFSLIDILK